MAIGQNGSDRARLFPQTQKGKILVYTNWKLHFVLCVAAHSKASHTPRLSYVLYVRLSLFNNSDRDNSSSDNSSSSNSSSNNSNSNSSATATAAEYSDNRNSDSRNSDS